MMRRGLVFLSVMMLPGILLPTQAFPASQSTTQPPSGSAAVQLPHPAAGGLSAERLARIDRVLQQYVDEERVAGVVALVLRDGQPVYERAFGWSDKEAGRRMATNTIFRIASQTKAITSVAVLSLVEEGTIDLNDPVSRYIPSFATTTVALRNDT